MKKYLLRYAIFWLPAMLMSYFFNNSTGISLGLQWFFAFFLILGWSVNTGMYAYHFPRSAMSSLLLYFGVNVLLIALMYVTGYGTVLNAVMIKVGGIFSFQPLDIVVRALLGFNIPHELYVLFGLVFCGLIGYVCGVVMRRVRPDPYRPQMLKK